MLDPNPADLTRKVLRRRGSAMVGAACVLLGLAVVSCGGDPTTPPPRTMSLQVSTSVAPDEELTASDLQFTGDKYPTVAIVTEDGGDIRGAEGPDGGPALRFPVYEANEEAPIGIVRVSSKAEDWLEPGEAPFAYGADVSLDALSSGTVHDNGDNILQRGLFVDPAQFKLQADHHRASCLVRGDDGEALVESKVTLQANQWYRLRCTRDDGYLQISVARLDDGQPLAAQTARVRADVGDIDFAAGSYLTVGGKVAQDGTPANATDQFNGVLAKAFVELGATS